MSRNDAPLHDRIRHLLGRSCETDQDILVTETGKSWVFLTPHHVYKQKKQVRDDLQDLTNLRARYDNTLTEIDLNRRLAPDIYEGAVRVAEDASGALSLNRPGQTVDWLVKMRRLPASRMLDQMVADHHGDEATLGVFVDMLAAVLVEFYRHAPRSNLNTEELLTLLEDQHAQCHAVLLHSKFAAHHARFNAVLDKFDASLGPFFKIFAERVEAGVIVECHGDLRPEHICLIDPPIIFDCLEFNRNHRQLDPFSEITFLGMECDLLGAPWIKPLLINALKLNTHDHPPAELLRFYEIIHALLRLRICLAHLLVAVPRKSEKWMPLGLRYLENAERLLQ